MNVSQIKAFVLYQTNNDQEDVGDFEPFLINYINEGYDRLAYAHARLHVKEGGEYPPLQADGDEPNLPAYAHMGIANWAAFCVYRNGNPARQNRGIAFRAAAEETATRLINEVSTAHFVNMPR